MQPQRLPRRLVLSFLLLFPAVCWPAAPRETAEAVAATIAARYWDAAAGARIAGDLRARAAGGSFDGHADPRELAAALGAALRPHDGHFDVRWHPVDAGPGPAAPPASAETERLHERRSAYGIRRVERLPGNLGLLQLAHFADFDPLAADAPARRAIDAALGLLAGADAVIVDLRGNGGGSPAMVGYLASAFLPPGIDAYNVFRHREGRSSEAPALPHPAPDPEIPLYVLVDGGTASAAEAFTYTLQQAGRARIVGEPTAGAANPGGPVPVGGGFEVFVPTGSPLNPRSGRNWEGTGVRPDLPAATADAAVLAQTHALQALLAGGTPATATDTRWALEALHAGGAADAAAWRAAAGRYGDAEIRIDGDRLWLQRGRRPLQRLLPLERDLFHVAGDPARRVRFERGPDGAVAVLELLDAHGGRQRLRREPEPDDRSRERAGRP